MSKSQRVKGAAGERELARILTEQLGCTVKRKLGAARDGGDDIQVGYFSIEVKRRKNIGAVRFLDQAEANARIDRVPIVAMREDGDDWCVMLRLKHFIPLMRGEL